MARKPISSVNALKAITDLSPVTLRYNGDAIMAAIARGKASTDSIARMQRLTDMNGYKAAYAAIKRTLRCASKRTRYQPSASRITSVKSTMSSTGYGRSRWNGRRRYRSLTC